MDHFELKILEAEIRDEEAAGHTMGFGKEAGKNSSGKQGSNSRGGKKDADRDDGQDGESNTAYQRRRILKRLIRIYGSSHECVDQFKNGGGGKSGISFMGDGVSALQQSVNVVKVWGRSGG